jgi:predicted Zn-dependent protease
MSGNYFKLNSAVIIIVAISGFLYYNTHAPCTTAITYKLGTFDTNFGISKENFLKDINQASNLWSTAAGKLLFIYNEKGSLTVNLIYDNRQKTTVQNAALKADSQKIANLAIGVRQEYENLEADYAQEKADYAASVTAFNKAQDSYSTEVAYWNTHGGAPNDEYVKLNEERAQLVSQQKILEAKRIQINTLVEQINIFIQKYNLLVNDANSRISTINQNAGKGQYDPSTNSVTIYEFSDNKKLLRVLAHEFGHSLGINHTTNPNSIMYALNQGTNFTLTKEDIVALKAVCKL